MRYPTRQDWERARDNEQAPRLTEQEKRVIERECQDPTSPWYGHKPSWTVNGKNGQGTPGRYLKVTSAADIPMKAIRWLWEDERDHWIPMGEITGLAGREGVGKSTWSAHMAAKVTGGELPGDFYGKPKGVVIVTTEDDWNATVQPRLVAAGADLSKVYHVQAIQADGLEDTVSLPNDLAEFERVIKEYDVALVILDPLLTLISKKLDTHKDAEIRQALGPLTRVAHDTRASFIGLIHVNKSTEGDLMNRVMGSRAIGAVVRAVLFCGTYRPIEDMADGMSESEFATPESPKRARFVFGQIKNNLQAKVMKSIEYHMAGQRVGYDHEAQKNIEGSYLVTDRVIPENVEDIVLEQEKRSKATKTEGGKAEVWLVGYLAGKGEVPSNTVIHAGEEIGLNRSAIHRARTKLGPDRIVVRKVAEMSGGTTWEYLPEKVEQTKRTEQTKQTERLEHSGIPSVPTLQKSGTNGVEQTAEPFDTCQTDGCGRQLIAPHSRQRGICESCYVHGPPEAAA